MKKLFFDIETSPNIGLFWEAGWKKTIDSSNIIQERSIICICYKYEGSDKIYKLTWDKNQCDKSMLEKFSKVLNESDLSITHNGDRFDIPWVRTRALYHGITDLANCTSLDTLLGSRNKLKFNSNRLDYIAQFFGVGQKQETTYGLWKDILLKNDKKALSTMTEYCANDVVILEKVYNKLLPVLSPKVHFGVLAGQEKCSCSNCASVDLKLSKVRITAAGTKKYQMKCSDCGSYTTVSEASYNKFNQ